MAAPSTEGYNPEWLELEKTLGGQRPLLAGTAEEMIQQYNALGAMLASQMPPPDASVSTTEEKIDNGVTLRIYKPKEAQDGQMLPVGVYTHGGGYICGNLDSEDPVCRALAHHVPCIIVSVDYRLGPQHKMPVMVDDTMAGYKWAWINADKYGGDQSKFFSVGGSAGGGLALAVADKCIEKGLGSHIQGIVAMTPVAVHPDTVPDKYKSQYTAYTENAKGVPVIDADSMHVFVSAAGATPHDVGTYPSLTKHAKDFPPTYITVCGKDPLRDDGVVMEALLRDAGVKTKITRWEGFPHYFWIFPSIPSGQKFMADLIAGTKWVLSQ